MKQVEVYELAIFNLIESFTKRYNKELFDEENSNLDFEVIWNKEVWFWPVEICDQFYSLDDIYIAEANRMPIKVISDYYEKNLEAHMEGKEFNINLINYYKKFWQT